MIGLSAELVAATTGTDQVGNRRGRVQHVAHTTAPVPGVSLVTPTGCLRRGRRPVCGQRARRWTVLVDGDPRPLCARCAAWAIRLHPEITQLPYLHATPDQIREALEQVTDPEELARLTHAICLRHDLCIARLPHVTNPQRLLTAWVADARNRLRPPSIAQPVSRRREPAPSAFPRRAR